MRFFRSLAGGVRALVRRGTTEKALHDELEDFMRRARDEHLRAGLPPQEAERLARVEVGSLAAAKDEVRAGLWEATLVNGWREVARAARRLGRTPGFALAAILTVATGTVAVAAMVTVIRSAFFTTVPFPRGDDLIRIWREEPGSARLELSYPDVRFLASRVRALDGFEATARARIVFLSPSGGRRVEGEAVTAGYFRLLGLQPAAGRPFHDEEYLPGTTGALLLASGTARALFGSESAAVGQSIRTPNGMLTIVGVMPPHFTGTIEDDSPEIEFWVPLESYVTEARREDAEAGGILAVGRLSPGASADRARAELHDLSAAMAALYPNGRGQSAYTTEPFAENWRSQLRRGAWMVLAAALGLLLAAALNTSALSLGRALDRRRVEALQLALGATRSRVVGCALIETSLVVAAGGALGAVCAAPATGLMLRQSTLKLPTYLVLAPDVRTVFFVVLALGVTAVLAGVTPALLAARVPLRLALAPSELARAAGCRPRVSLQRSAPDVRLLQSGRLPHGRFPPATGTPRAGGRPDDERRRGARDVLADDSAAQPAGCTRAMDRHG